MSRADWPSFGPCWKGTSFGPLRRLYVPENGPRTVQRGNPKLRLLSRAQDASDLAHDYTATGQAADRSLTSENILSTKEYTAILEACGNSHNKSLPCFSHRFNCAKMYPYLLPLSKLTKVIRWSRVYGDISF